MAANGVARIGKAGKAWPDTAERPTARRGEAGPASLGWRGAKGHGPARHGEAGIEWLGTERLGPARPDTAGKARAAGQGQARPDNAERSEMNLPHVRVTARPNPSFPDGFLLDFAEDCPYCGKRHHHGGTLDEDGTYGHRVAHCVDVDRSDNDGYILIPAGGEK